MTNGQAVVIEGKCHFWPGGPQTLTALPADRERDRAACWFGARADPDGNEMWFRLTLEAIYRMRENTPARRGARLVERLIRWLGENPEHQLDDGYNGFRVYVSDVGDTRIERHDD